MAVGLARMLGIEFIKNFDAPYHSTSITEFWRRWHISLGSFIRDYLYIPLGGNRVPLARMYFNLCFCFFICGLWHGAKMTFIIWGVFQGVFMVLERIRGKKSLFAGIPLPVQILLCNILLMFSWTIFRAPSLAQALTYWSSMLGLVHPAATTPLLHAEIFTPRHLFSMALCAIFVFQPVQAHEWVKKGLSTPGFIVVTAVFILALCAMFTQTYNPFLYFQF
jgi:alginate O-acetyltransferase complex protein AlgI